MKKKLLVLLFSLTSLALVSCGGGNDVASSGTTAVSAAASTASTPSTPAPEPKVNGQVDERTGVAPVVAALTAWSPFSNGGCLRSRSLFVESPWFKDGPAITSAQRDACFVAVRDATDTQNERECRALGGNWQPTTWYCSTGNATNSQQCSALEGAWQYVRALCSSQ
jgi:predicted small secreted protein